MSSTTHRLTGHLLLQWTLHQTASAKYLMTSPCISSLMNLHDSNSVSSLLDLIVTFYPANMADIAVGREFSDHCLITFSISSHPIPHSTSHLGHHRFTAGKYGNGNRQRTVLGPAAYGHRRFSVLGPISSWTGFRHISVGVLVFYLAVRNPINSL